MDEAPVRGRYSLTKFCGNKEGRRRWNVILPCAGIVAKHVTQAMHLSGRAVGAHLAEPHPRRSSVGMVVDYFLGLQIREPAGYLELPPGVDASRGRFVESLSQRTSSVPSGLEDVRGLRDVFLQMALEIPGRQLPTIEQTAALFGLGAFESAYRAGAKGTAGLVELRPLVGLSLARLRRRLRSLYPETAIEDARRCCEHLLDLVPSETPLHYNPIFGGFGAILGSDGDLLSGRVFFDLKCAADVPPQTIWQLMGYACLEEIRHPGRRRMDAVGLINPRYRYTWQMDLDALCRAAGGDSFADAVRTFQRLLAPPSQDGREGTSPRKRP